MRCWNPLTFWSNFNFYYTFKNIFLWQTLRFSSDSVNYPLTHEFKKKTQNLHTVSLPSSSDLFFLKVVHSFVKHGKLMLTKQCFLYKKVHVFLVKSCSVFFIPNHSCTHSLSLLCISLESGKWWAKLPMNWIFCNLLLLLDAKIKLIVNQKNQVLHK